MTTEIVNYQKASKRSKLQKSTRSGGFEITELLTINQHGHYYSFIIELCPFFKFHQSIFPFILSLLNQVTKQSIVLIQFRILNFIRYHFFNQNIIVAPALQLDTHQCRTRFFVILLHILKTGNIITRP